MVFLFSRYVLSRNKSKLHQLLCSIQSTCSICSFTFGVEVISGPPLGIQYLLSLHWVPETLDDDTTTFQTVTVRPVFCQWPKTRQMTNFPEHSRHLCPTMYYIQKHASISSVANTLTKYMLCVHVMPNFHKNACWIRKLCSQIWILNCSFSCTSKILQIFQQRYSW